MPPLPRIFGALCVALLLPACMKFGEDKKKTDDDAQESPLVRVGSLRRITLDKSLEVTGTVEAMTYVTVNPRIEDAEILELRADVGDRVAAGDVLAVFDPTDAKLILDDAKVAQAEAAVQLKESEIALRDIQSQGRAQKLTLDQAQRSLDRAKAQAERGAISQESLDTIVYKRDSEVSQQERLAILAEKSQVMVDLARKTLEKRGLAIARAERRLAWATLRAPIGGIVARRQATVGQETFYTSLARGALFEIFDPASLVVNAQITQRDLALVKVGLPVDIRADAFPGVPFAGTVSVISPVVDAAAGTVAIRIAIKGNEKLKPGLFAAGRIVIEAREGTLVVPKRAVLYERERPYVMKIGIDGAHTRATRVFFREGLSAKEDVEVVTEGNALAEGDSIVLVGHDRLRDGDEVRVETPAGGLVESKPATTPHGG